MFNLKKKNLLLICCLLLFSASAFSQKLPEMMDRLPLDPNVRTGILPNGMRYYVRKNSKPEKRAELRLAVNAGSAAETDEQQGLAHFCEHMAFNGTTNFKKNDLINYSSRSELNLVHTSMHIPVLMKRCI